MAQNGDGNLRFWRTKKPSYLGSWCAPQPVAVFPLHGSKLTVASAGRHTMGATLTALRALHPRGVPTYPQLPVQHGGMPHLRFSRHSFWKGRSVSFTSYLFNVNIGKPSSFWLSSVFFSTSFHCLWMMVISLPFLNRVSDHHQHGHASSQSAGAREAGMPSRTEPAGQRYAI